MKSEKQKKNFLRGRQGVCVRQLSTLPNCFPFHLPHIRSIGKQEKQGREKQQLLYGPFFLRSSRFGQLAPPPSSFYTASQMRDKKNGGEKLQLRHGSLFLVYFTRSPSHAFPMEQKRRRLTAVGYTTALVPSNLISQRHNKNPQ